MTEKVPKTIFFAACRGVFAGGGCRAAAHVGAYEAAIEAGVNFSEVAGTSAGSIIAALIGAGATPAFILEHLGNLSFSSLLTNPTGSSINTGLLGGILNRVPFLRKTLPVKIGIYGGGYSSDAIEQWVEDRLADLLPDAQGPITFKDLLLPTSVVASNLSGARAKVWSTALTPDDPVALAVRCSCSIPLFFEPVSIGNGRFVDGGLLSNLPGFVFAATESSDPAGRILAFSLEDDSNPPAKWNIREYVRSLSATLVGGATELQSSMQPRLNVISIPTGSIKATDFDINADQINSLRQNGRTAVFKFIEEEALHLRSELSRPISQVDEESFSAEFVEEARTLGRELVVSMAETRWFWDYFPTVLAWREAGASLKVLVEPLSGSRDHRAREMLRRTLLAKLGATIIEKEELPFYGYFLLREDENRGAAFLKNSSDTPGASFGSAYSGAHNRPLLQILKRSIDSEFPTTSPAAASCTLQECPAEDIIKLLKKGVGQYEPAQVTITLEDVPLERVRMLVRKVRTFKFSQVKHLVDLYEHFGLAPFVPALILAGSDPVSVVTPPVLEEWGSHLVAIEGNTRTFLFHKQNRKTMKALVVRGVTQPLPGRPVSPARALLHTSYISSGDRIEGFNFDQFRSIEGSVRPVS